MQIRRNSILGILIFAYIALLWRSATREMDAEIRASWTIVTESKHGFLRLLRNVHISLWRYLLQKSIRINAFFALWARIVSDHALNAPGRAVDIMGRYSLEFQDEFQKRIEAWLDSQVDILGEKIKAYVKDPFMPLALQSLVDDAVDSLLPDAKRVLFTKTDEMIRYQSPFSRYWHPRLQPTAENVLKLRRRRLSSLASFEEDRIALLEKRNKKRRHLLRRRRRRSESKTATAISTALDEAFEDLSDFGSDDEYDVNNNNNSDVEGYFDVDDDYILDDLDAEIIDQSRHHHNSSLLRDDEFGLTADDFLTDLSFRVRFKLRLRVLRAFILYNLSPYDQSIWECMWNPWWIMFCMIGVIPYGFGVSWWLFMFFLHEKNDEYQVCQFIVGFKTANFLSQGCFSLIAGAFKYYLCATWSGSELRNNCVDSGPRVYRYSDALFFFAQITLVWLCFFILPKTQPCKVVSDPSETYLLEDAEKREKLLGPRPRGGRLYHLFWWDTFTIAFVMSVAMFAFFVVEQQWWQYEVTLYWCRTLYGLLSIPFVLFKLPGIHTLLTPIKATGYDREGRIVLSIKRTAYMYNYNKQYFYYT